jgi:hypothetical protein
LLQCGVRLFDGLPILIRKVLDEVRPSTAACEAAIFFGGKTTLFLRARER